jgi:hypothetical protein
MLSASDTAGLRVLKLSGQAGGIDSLLAVRAIDAPFKP